MSRQTTAHPKVAGITIGIATILAMLFLAHHPVAGGQERGEILNDIVQKASMDRLVHGGLIAIMGAAGHLESFRRSVADARAALSIGEL